MLNPEVIVFGGTHGNEVTGCFLLNHWQANKAHLVSTYFQTKLVLSNPRAVQLCRRYVDHDLNRCFLPEDLYGESGTGVSQSEGKVVSSESSRDTSYEYQRAREIVRDLGGEEKCAQSFLIDLHTTTSNMGPTIILTTLEPENLWVASWLSQKIDGLRVITNELPREKSPFVNSLSPYGFCVEVGPVAQGCFSPQVIQLTQKVVEETLVALDALAGAQWNFEKAPFVPAQVETFEYERVMDYPRRADGSLLAFVHPERFENDFIPVEKGSPLFMDALGNEYFLDFEGIFWPIFVGESAYVEKETAMVLTKRVLRSWKGSGGA